MFVLNWPIMASVLELTRSSALSPTGKLNTMHPGGTAAIVREKFDIVDDVVSLSVAVRPVKADIDIMLSVVDVDMDNVLFAADDDRRNMLYRVEVAWTN